MVDTPRKASNKQKNRLSENKIICLMFHCLGEICAMRLRALLAVCCTEEIRNKVRQPNLDLRSAPGPVFGPGI